MRRQNHVIKENSHDGITIGSESDRFWISAWAENWEDLWEWEAEITRNEFDSILADNSAARKLLQSERHWTITPPPSVPRKRYTKQGVLENYDGFQDAGTGGKA